MTKRRWLLALAALVLLGTDCEQLPLVLIEPSCAPGTPYVLFWVDDAGREVVLETIHDPDVTKCRRVEWEQKDDLWWRCGDSEPTQFVEVERTLEVLLRCDGRFE